MKTMKIKLAAVLIMLTAFFGSTSLFAGPSADGNDSPGIEQVRQTIAKQIKYPEFAVENLLQGDVTVLFGIDKSNKLTVYSAKSEVKELADYVSENLSTLDLKDLEVGKVYRIVITFNLI